MDAWLVVLGLAAGILSGLVGIGGGVVIIPALVFLFGFTQAKAQGTTLALMIPPIGLLAASTYFRAGNVDVRSALFIVLGFVFGGLVGSLLAQQIPEVALGKIFGVFIIAVGIRMLFA